MGDENLNVIGEAKVIQLGSQKMLVVEIENDAPEGEYKIQIIKGNPTGPTGAGLGCVIRFGVEA
ncbi:TPA: hypothetical protein ACSP0P_002699 [Citrobacter freundii]